MQHRRERGFTLIVLLVVGGAIGGLAMLIFIIPAAAFVRDMDQYLYLRVGNVPPDEALDRSLGEYGADALRTRWRMEDVAPAAELGNRGFGCEYPLDAEPRRPKAAEADDRLEAGG